MLIILFITNNILQFISSALRQKDVTVHTNDWQLNPFASQPSVSTNRKTYIFLTFTPYHQFYFRIKSKSILTMYTNDWQLNLFASQPSTSTNIYTYIFLTFSHITSSIWKFRIKDKRILTVYTYDW